MFHEVTSQVLSYYEDSSEQVKMAAGAMMAKMRDLNVTKGKNGKQCMLVVASTVQCWRSSTFTTQYYQVW